MYYQVVPIRKVLTAQQCILTDLRVSSNIVDVLSHEVSEAVGHEHSTQPHLHHLLHLTVNKTNLLQLLQLNSLGQLMHLHPRHSCEDVCSCMYVCTGMYLWVYERNIPEIHFAETFFCDLTHFVSIEFCNLYAEMLHTCKF